MTGADYARPARPPGVPVGPPKSAVRFSYDAVGNRVEVAEDGRVTRFTANSLNQYTQVGEFAPTYDRNGNLASMGKWLYRYDAMNRLTEASDGAMTAKFFYDAKNRCVARSYNGSVTLNTYDRWNLIDERDSRGAQVARYVHGRKIDEIVVMVNRFGTFYPHRDVLGNVTMLTDKEGKLVERYSYSVEGKVTVKDAAGTELAASAVGNRWMYTGREWLNEVGLFDYRNRVYSATLGRFLQTDPIRFSAGDINIYRYVYNGYTNFTDPYGLQTASLDLNFSASFGIGISLQLSYVEDSNGSYDMQLTLSKGTAVGFPTFSGNVLFSSTNAAAVDDLLGAGAATGMAGGSVVGLEANYIFSQSYTGYQVGGGWTSPGLTVSPQVYYGYTWSLPALVSAIGDAITNFWTNLFE